MSLPLLQAAILAYESGRYRESAMLCHQGLAQTPGDEGLLTLLAVASQADGNAEAATDAFHELTRLYPSTSEYWSNLGVMLREQHRFGDAEDAFRQAMSLAPKDYGTLINYGLLLLDLGRLADARHRFLDAHDVEPDSVEARIHGALACFECGDNVRAEALLPADDTWTGLDTELRNRLIAVLTHVGRLQDAERLLESGAGVAPDASTIARLAMLHERTNRLDSARELLDRIRDHVGNEDIDMRADALTVDTALAIRAKDFEHARVSVKSLLEMPLPPQTMANNHFTAAKIADKLGDLDETMSQLAQAHDIHFRIASEIAPEIAASVADPLRIAAQWMQPQECVFPRSANDPTAGQSPVFILGFPRSGTTMLEQMLDAHPGYASMDERTIVQRCVEEFEATGLSYPHQLDQLDESELARLRALYWSESAKVVQRSDTQVLVDKNPLNMLRLPMINRLFPNARIILALRHPCDVILSCYMQNFRSPAFMILCSTLERLSRSYVNAMRFWIHHQDLLSPRLLTLRYEETVGDFLPQVERIADFLGIEDRRPLAEFSTHAASKGYISTPSYSQVVEPVNTRAVARWKAYRAWFEPVFPILEPIAGHWNYRLED